MLLSSKLWTVVVFVGGGVTIKLLIDSIFVSGLHAFEELVYEGITLAQATTGVVLGLSLYEFIILLIFYGFVAYTVLFDVFQIYRVYQSVSCCLFTRGGKASCSYCSCSYCCLLWLCAAELLGQGGASLVKSHLLSVWEVLDWVCNIALVAMGERGPAALCRVVRC